jgi:UMF1 family MFS transporter
MLCSTVMSGIAVPFVGALSDKLGRRIPFIILFTSITCGAALLIPFSPLYAVLALAILSLFSYATSLAVYDALLPKIAGKDDQGSVSGFGVALGYMGTPVVLGVTLLVLRQMGYESATGMQTAFFIAAGGFFIVALYPFFIIHEAKTPKGRTFAQEVQASLQSLRESLHQIVRTKGFLQFLGAAFLIMNATMTVIVFLGTFQKEVLGLGTEVILMVQAGLAVPAVIGAWVFGKLSDRIGARRVIQITAGLWIVAFVLMITTQVWANQYQGADLGPGSGVFSLFLCVAAVGGVGLGGFTAAVRPMLIKFADPDKMGEYFGFLAMVNKASVALGPPVFGAVASGIGYAPAIGILVGFLILALVLLRFVPDRPREG